MQSLKKLIIQPQIGRVIASLIVIWVQLNPAERDSFIF